ncbi:phage late control D family protein [Paenibacillus hubeiensis]|uniref:phage late control D family protein n=1 Tax=Paenibacillus hubeiensis TaxID=3077330 RepID=UPI0031BAB43B
MSSVQNARRSLVAVKYQGKNITEELAKYLSDFSYDDNAPGEQDQITLTLDDRERRWIKTWKPNIGDKIIAEIQVSDWDKAGHKAKLNCGSFEVETVELSGPPNIVAITATAIPQAGQGALREQRTKAWEKVKLRTIAQEIANRARLKLLYSVNINPTYDRQDQSDESDFAFLSKICADEGIAIKVSGSQLVLFDESEYEKKDPVMTIEYGKNPLVSYSFSETSTSAAYASCVVTYKSTVSAEKKKGAKGKKEKGKTKVITGSYTLPGVKGPTLKVNEQVDTVAQAQRLARNKLREQNKQAGLASFSLSGSVGVAAGITITVKGFGRYDGKYIVIKSSHKVSASGAYTTDIEVRKVLAW